MKIHILKMANVINKKNHIVLLSLFFVSVLGSCFNNLNSNWVKSKSNNGNDNTDINQLNFDNKIYKSNRVFSYTYTIRKKNKNYIFGILPKSQFINSDSIQVCLIKSHSIFKKHAFYVDSINMTVFSAKGHSRLSKSQTLIGFEYYSQGKCLLDTEISGIIEDSSRIFLHPPRSYYLERLELCPFPQIYFPIVIEKKWTGKLNIPQDWFTFLPYQKQMGVQCEYTVIGKKSIKLFNNLIEECFEINAVGKIEGLQSSESIFYFSENYGFVKMIFREPSGDKIEFNLNNIKNDSNI